MIYFASYITLLGFGFVVLRRLAPRDYELDGRLSPLTAFLQVILFFLYGGFPIIYLEEDWPAVSVPPAIFASGALLISLGLAGILVGLLRLGVRRSIGRGKPRLEFSGVYRLTRNPQALACALYVIGFFMLWPSWYALGWALLYPILIHMMIRTEEVHLGRLHGQQYLDYCANTPRYLSLRHLR